MRRVRTRIDSAFEHHRVKPGHVLDQVIDSGLFSEETWRLFGLNEGPAGGRRDNRRRSRRRSFDLATAGHSLGLPTIVGAASGAVGSFLMGKRRPELKAKLPGGFSLDRASICNSAAARFRSGPAAPRIFLDSARTGQSAYFAIWSIDLTPAATMPPWTRGQLKAVLEQHQASSSWWDDEKRKACEKVFEAMRRNRVRAEQRTLLYTLLRERLGELSHVPARPLALILPGFFRPF